MNLNDNNKQFENNPSLILQQSMDRCEQATISYSEKKISTEEFNNILGSIQMDMIDLSENLSNQIDEMQQKLKTVNQLLEKAQDTVKMASTDVDVQELPRKLHEMKKKIEVNIFQLSEWNDIANKIQTSVKQQLSIASKTKKEAEDNMKELSMDDISIFSETNESPDEAYKSHLENILGQFDNLNYLFQKKDITLKQFAEELRKLKEETDQFVELLTSQISKIDNSLEEIKLEKDEVVREAQAGSLLEKKEDLNSSAQSDDLMISSMDGKQDERGFPSEFAELICKIENLEQLTIKEKSQLIKWRKIAAELNKCIADAAKSADQTLKNVEQSPELDSDASAFSALDSTGFENQANEEPHNFSSSNEKTSKSENEMNKKEDENTAIDGTLKDESEKSEKTGKHCSLHKTKSANEEEGKSDELSSLSEPRSTKKRFSKADEKDRFYESDSEYSETDSERGKQRLHRHRSHRRHHHNHHHLSRRRQHSSEEPATRHRQANPRFASQDVVERYCGEVDRIRNAVMLDAIEAEREKNWEKEKQMMLVMMKVIELEQQKREVLNKEREELETMKRIEREKRREEEKKQRKLEKERKKKEKERKRKEEEEERKKKQMEEEMKRKKEEELRIQKEEEIRKLQNLQKIEKNEKIHFSPLFEAEPERKSYFSFSPLQRIKYTDQRLLSPTSRSQQCSPSAMSFDDLQASFDRQMWQSPKEQRQEGEEQQQQQRQPHSAPATPVSFHHEPFSQTSTDFQNRSKPLRFPIVLPEKMQNTQPLLHSPTQLKSNPDSVPPSASIASSSPRSTAAASSSSFIHSSLTAYEASQKLTSSSFKSSSRIPSFLNHHPTHHAAYFPSLKTYSPKSSTFASLSSSLSSFTSKSSSFSSSTQKLDFPFSDTSTLPFNSTSSSSSSSSSLITQTPQLRKLFSILESPRIQHLSSSFKVPASSSSFKSTSFQDSLTSPSTQFSSSNSSPFDVPLFRLSSSILSNPLEQASKSRSTR
ncbi:uncharacterized protein MONOS_6795 [Monocercomonoides exilis]|uniref:uncharacterized protein n=1 Tax=Monocercomonoides exilis TaxID=2049356 RepID=UPI003559A49D|nr:hypothetical protein MONOS_6795 [Monocercomonoides exilis]|eukprot:MONOS_6795.1-p1 / transcript=MONOS_6795.1 / gene=MONOS_6795 / organism=Monocercomonoides_exilis_PA203 / gene_product=unspecified product / transcript_product=unspecified product / location=Mono_scaffold00221:25498-29021(-) / protein_length=993 / sequence_SO=supercontig / SO=protein_coding / is_pseudo=false